MVLDELVSTMHRKYDNIKSKVASARDNIPKLRYLFSAGLAAFVLSHGDMNKASADPTFTEVPICTEINGQEWPDIHGRYIVWYDRRGAFIDVYAYDTGPDEIPNTLDDLGEIRVTDDSWDQFTPAVHDHNGEAFISYGDSRFGSVDVRLARVVNGVVVSDVLIAGGIKPQGDPDILVKSDGTYIIVFTQADGNFTDENFDNDDYNIYKSINGGVPVVVCNAINDQIGPSIGSDGTSEVIAWEDIRNDTCCWPDIYMKIDDLERMIPGYHDSHDPKVDGDYIGFYKWNTVYLYNWKTEEIIQFNDNFSERIGGVSRDWILTWHTTEASVYIYKISTKEKFLTGNGYYPAINVTDSVLNVVYEKSVDGDRDIYASTSTDFNNTSMPSSSLAGLVSLGIGLLGLGYKKLRED